MRGFMHQDRKAELARTYDNEGQCERRDVGDVTEKYQRQSDGATAVQDEPSAPKIGPLREWANFL